MYKRSLAKDVTERLSVNPAVAILGPRQVGKTTLALEIAKDRPSVYLDLQDEKDQQLLVDPDRYLRLHENDLVILDEVQQLPGLFKSLRGIIDKRRRKGINSGQFLLLGSASQDLLKQSSESLAGRISYLELAGLSPSEIDAEDSDGIQQLWLRGGFPLSYREKNDRASLRWRRDFIRTYLERDIPILGPKIPAITLSRFWSTLAFYQGEQFNASALARALDNTSVTTSRYLNIMNDLMLVRSISPWHGQVNKRLVKRPRVYVRDSGIMHALIGIEDYEDLYSHPARGKSWEGFVIEKIISILPKDVIPFYFRTAQGAEIDLVLQFNRDERWAIEIKLSRTPKVKKGFHSASADIGAKRKLVVYGGDDVFSLGHDTTAVSLLNILKILHERHTGEEYSLFDW